MALSIHDVIVQRPLRISTKTNSLQLNQQRLVEGLQLTSRSPFFDGTTPNGKNERLDNAVIHTMKHFTNARLATSYIYTNAHTYVCVVEEKNNSNIEMWARQVEQCPLTA